MAQVEAAVFYAVANGHGKGVHGQGDGYKQQFDESHPRNNRPQIALHKKIF